MVKADIGYYGELIGGYVQVALTVIGCLKGVVNSPALRKPKNPGSTLPRA